MVSSRNGTIDFGSGRVTCRGSGRGHGLSSRVTLPAKVPWVSSDFSPASDCDDKYEKGNGKCASRKTIFILGWVLVFTTMILLLSTQLYRHVKTVDPCVRAQMSQAVLESFNSGSSSSTIPMIIHQQWRTSIIENEEGLYNDRWGDWHTSWHRLFPESDGYKHMLWTDKMMLDLITEHYPWFLPVYNSYPANIQRIDASRYFVLYHYGGVYADMDYEPLSNFWKWLPSDRVSLIESPYWLIEEAQNSLMASPQGHPFWNVTFKVLAEKADERDVLSSTGPKMLSAVMEQTPSNYWYILPCENFQRIPSAKDGSSPWHTVVIQQMFLAMPQKSCGNWDKQGPGDCQFGLHHNSASWVKNKGFVKYWLDR